MSLFDQSAKPWITVKIAFLRLGKECGQGLQAAFSALFQPPCAHSLPTRHICLVKALWLRHFNSLGTPLASFLDI